MDWSTFFPAITEPESEQFLTEVGDIQGEAKPVKKITKAVTVADIGCGFGGLLVALATKLPDELILGPSAPSPSDHPSILYPNHFLFCPFRRPR